MKITESTRIYSILTLQKSVPVKRRSDEYEPAKGDVPVKKNAKKEWNNAHVFVKPPEPSVEHSPSRLKTPVKALLDQSTINALVISVLILMLVTNPFQTYIYFPYKGISRLHQTSIRLSFGLRF